MLPILALFPNPATDFDEHVTLVSSSVRAPVK